MMTSVNLWAVLVAAAANFIIGFLLHGPIGGKLWMKLANVTPTGNEKMADMMPQMFWNFVANFVFAFVLAEMLAWNGMTELAWNGMTGASRGMFFGFLVWLGYVVTTSSMNVIWMKQSFKLWMYENFSSLVCILAMGAIIAAW
jgi:hypothetical protein